MRTIVLTALVLCFAYLGANYVENNPFEHTQPDGSRLNLFVSGDEYYHRVHDADNFTILLHPESGYAVYAIPDGNTIRASEYVVGSANPASLGIQPGLFKDLTAANQLKAERQALRDAGNRGSPTGTLNNIVGFVRFNDQTNFPTTPSYTSYYNNFMSTSQQSLADYYDEVSSGALDINSYLYPGAGTGGYPMSFQVDHDRGYYSPYNASTNPGGYTTEAQGQTRMYYLVQELLGMIDDYIPAGLDLDNDDDGIIDGLTFIFRGLTDSWGDILWPAHWTWGGSLGELNGADVTHYVFDFEGSSPPTGVSVICHEMGHMIGFPDFYHYTSNGITPVGSWDLMASDNAQHSLTYNKKKYGTWFSTIPVITPTSTPTTYTLTAIDQNPYACYRINSSLTNEYYMLEYRRDTGRYESGIPGSGLIVYRIISTYDGNPVNGNAGGPPDEVYVYRIGGDIDTNGTTNSANLSSTVGRTKIHTDADPEPWLYSSTGTQLDGNLVITDVGVSGGTTISFVVRDSPPNIWDGSSSTAWNTAANWSLNHVPTVDEDVEIPNVTNDPVVSTIQSCRSLVVKSGAVLTISSGTLTVANDFTNFGILTMNNNAGNLWVQRDLFFETGSSTNITADAEIYVQSDVEFRTGSSVNMTYGYLEFYGTGPSYFRTYVASAVNHLRSDKDSPNVMGFSAVSSATLTINGNFWTYDGSTSTHPYTGTTILKGSLNSNYSGSKVQFNSGTLNCEGTASATISFMGTENYLNNLTVNKSSGYTVYLAYPAEVQGNFSLQSGNFNPQSHTFTVGGHWTNGAGIANFIEGTGTVVLNGSSSQTISTETFYALELNKPAGTMLISTGSTVICTSYDWTAGAYSVSGGTFTVGDLADSGIFGTITLSGGTINYTQGTDQFVDLRCNLTISGGTFNVTGGSSSAWFSYIDTATLTLSGSGVLDFKSVSVYISSSYAFNDNISGGTIRTVGSFSNNRADYNPTGGTIEFYGPLDCQMQNTAGSNVHRVYINKSSTRSEDDSLPEFWREKDGSIIPVTRSNTVTGVGPLDINGNLVINAGTFVAPAEINLAGGWYNYYGPDHFLEGTGTVTFDGNDHQYCNYTENFNAIVINKSAGALRVSGASAVVTCATYNWVAGAVDVLAGTFTANDLVQNGIYGNFYNNTGGTINLTQDTGSLLDLNGFIYNYGGTYNIYGGSMSVYPAYSADAGIVMTSGVIDIKNKGMTIVTRPYALTWNITGGTIRTVSWFSDTRGGIVFAGGKVELYGSTQASAALGAGSSFYDLEINKASAKGEKAIGLVAFPTDRLPEETNDFRVNDILLNSDIVITHDLILTAGNLNVSGSNYNITIAGSWINNVGTAGFTAGIANVTFNKAGDLQDVTGETQFYNVTDAHTGAALRFLDDTGIGGTLLMGNIVTFHGGGDLNNVNNASAGDILAFYGEEFTITSYTGGGDLRAWSYSDVTVLDVTQNGFYGNFTCDNSHLELHQDVSNWPDLNGNMTISNNGIVDIYGGSMDTYIGYNANCVFTLSTGEFNVKNHGIYLYNNGYTCDMVVSGGTIRANGNWTDTWGIFDPTGGTVELTGSGDNNISCHASSWFRALRINKVATRDNGEPAFQTDREGNTTPVTRSCNLTIGACTVISGFTITNANIVYLSGSLNCSGSAINTITNGTLRLNGSNWISNGSIALTGTLVIDPGSSLQMANAKSINVNSGGYFLGGGTSTYPAMVTHISGNYGLTVNSGGTIGGLQTIFEYMNANGVLLMPGSSVSTDYPFDYCTFRLGASGGRLLWINNNQSFTINGAVFPANTWGGSYNVSKTADAGIVYFDNWTGDFGGPTFEQDTYAHVYWEGFGVPPVTDLGIQYISATNRVQLDWTYPLAATSYRIYRSTTPYGTFSYYTQTTANSWSQVVPGPKYFYKVTAVVP